ncbi:hypothetical protein [Teredinibacter haidensis]|uniref:hypothetical protein n=1 Tax=Teredinibacter haidensis TaxID=2731755 RepID=UPI000948AE8A|nr:hypothetical protein [Teredinibacter haidensis]
MKLIVTPSIKMFLVALCLSQASVSCALDQTRITGNDKEEVQAMTSQKRNCKSNSIIKSQSLIDFVLKDILANYTHSGGGGITSIKETLTNTYEVSIAQEERVDVLTYELAIDERCTATLLKKTGSTVNFGQ